MSLKERIDEIVQTLNRSIFVGERYERNLRNIRATSTIVMLLGVVLTLLNVMQGQYVVALSPFAFLIAGIVSYISAAKYKRREGAIIVTMIAIMLVLTYDVLFVKNGFAYLWTMMVPLAVCYMFSVKMGILITAYFQLLFVTVFYTPLRALVATHYSEIALSRFPLLYFFHGLVVLYVMYQYHKSVLFEIEHTDRLNEEVAKQTAVAEERARKIEQMSFQTIQTLAHAIDAKDPYTRGHSSRVSQYSVMIAETVGWDKDRVNDLRYAALLHDIGKIGIPDSILNNPRRLTDVEYEIIKSHTTMGGEILRNKIMVRTADDVATSHHERYDGNGYPNGLKGNDISEEARIVAIADAFDAMSSNRVYRKACDREHIMSELVNGKGRQFDPNYADVFIGLWERGQLDEIIKSDAAESEGSLEAPSALLQEVVEAFTTQSTADDIDVITGVMSRSAGETAIAQAMREESGCFVFFDLDNLKKINDTNGHKAGDKALRLMGDTLRENLGDGLCCRLGGDEFLMFTRDATEEAAAARVGRIISEYEAKKQGDYELSPASISAGMVMCTPADTYIMTYNMADKALYHVKQNGKNSYSFYNRDSESLVNEQVDIQKLIYAIRNSGSYEGALDVEYRQFAKLYEFIGNLDRRFSTPYQLIMISLDNASDEPVHMDELERAMYYMEQAIRQTIRNVDVLTRYSRRQFLIILIGTDSIGAKTAVDRIFMGYFKMNGSGAFSPSYSIADLSENDE